VWFLLAVIVLVEVGSGFFVYLRRRARIPRSDAAAGSPLAKKGV
jgi:hypothetical protein